MACAALPGCTAPAQVHCLVRVRVRVRVRIRCTAWLGLGLGVRAS